MQKFVNNWKAQLTAAVGPDDGMIEVLAEAAALLVDAPSGAPYVLTLFRIDDAGREVAWEVIQVIDVSGGEVMVQRDMEGHGRGSWVAGDWVALRVTARFLNGLVQYMETQEIAISTMGGAIQQLSSAFVALESSMSTVTNNVAGLGIQLAALSQRVDALEGGGEPVPEGSHRLTVYGEEDYDMFGYYEINLGEGYLGGLEPALIDWQGQTGCAVHSIYVRDNGSDPAQFGIVLWGSFSAAPVSLDVEGIGLLAFADAQTGEESWPSLYTWWEWQGVTHDWEIGSARLITVNLA